ncbi:MAG: ABC transporter permease [Eubacteriales bacterium]|nr:ABC transporter permease [Clostridiales bacterium]MDY4887650.1 ABC transporter permease [Eubacteriales bacterium]MDY5861224.1 ABC transporter permease [Eubacteriales bacterium]
MFRFAIKNMAIKKVQVILVVLSIVISAGVGVLAFNTAEQVSDGITGTAAYYSAIVGPAGSKTQLAMNTMYFTDSPLGTIPYSVVSDLQKDSRVTEVVPFAMADSYNGHSVVGSTSAFLSEKAIAEGRMFDDSATFEVVLGAAVARVNGVKVGDEIHTSHSVGDEHHEALTVVGILEESHTVYDNVVFTQLRTIWEVHEHEEEEETHDAAEGEGEEHVHAGEETVCAILVRTKNPGYAMQLVNEYDGKVITTQDLDTFTLQAIEPMDTVRGILEETNNTKYIVFVLCAIILVMNIMIISIITLLNMYHSAKEISLMRLIGISMKKINLLYIIQNSLIGLVSIMLAFGVSRLCLVFMKDYVASMGVVLNVAKVYPLEIVILLGVFLISVLPTVVCTFMMSGKDGISE